MKLQLTGQYSFNFFGFKRTGSVNESIPVPTENDTVTLWGPIQLEFLITDNDIQAHILFFDYPEFTMKVKPDASKQLHLSAFGDRLDLTIDIQE